MLRDCWKYHKNLFKECDCHFCIDTLENDICDLNPEGWEDVNFFAGYIRGLNFSLERLDSDEIIG
jgi:hypothetical protein